MATFNEPIRPLEFLVSEAPGSLSRENAVIEGGAGAMVAGRVLGQKANGKYVAYDNASGTAGVNVASAILAYDAPANASDQNVTIIERLAEVKAAEIGWGTNDSTGITAGIADLLLKNIKVRNA